jgi:hypothetical protein
MLVDMPQNISVAGASPAGRSLGAIALRSGQPNALLTLLRRLPGVGRLLAGPAFSRPDTRYLVRLGMAGADTLCLQSPCYQATLLNGTVPASLLGAERSALTMVGSTLLLQVGSGADT